MVVTLNSYWKAVFALFLLLLKKLFVSRQIHIFELSLNQAHLFFLHLSFRLVFELSSNRQWLNYARIIIFGQLFVLLYGYPDFHFIFTYNF